MIQESADLEKRKREAVISYMRVHPTAQQWTNVDEAIRRVCNHPAINFDGGTLTGWNEAIESIKLSCPSLVRTDPAPQTAQSVHRVDQIFGKNSNAALANRLALENKNEYHRLKQIAKEIGLI